MRCQPKTALLRKVQGLFLLPSLLLPLLAGAEEVPRLSHFDPLVGRWEGELDYLDYGDDRTRVTLPTWLTCSRSSKGDALRLEYRYSEPDGSRVDGFELLRVANQPGMLFFDGLYTVENVETDSTGALSRVVLSTEGQDNERAATIRKSILIQEDSLRFQKEVRYEGVDAFLLRSEYRFQRSP